jgi:hypothetical protein
MKVLARLPLSPHTEHKQAHNKRAQKVEDESRVRLHTQCASGDAEEGCGEGANVGDYLKVAGQTVYVEGVMIGRGGGFWRFR